MCQKPINFTGVTQDYNHSGIIKTNKLQKHTKETNNNRIETVLQMLTLRTLVERNVSHPLPKG